MVVVTLALAFWTRAAADADFRPPVPPALFMSLGFDRESETATFLAHVCAAPPPDSAPECAAPAPPSLTTTIIANRPTVLTVELSKEPESLRDNIPRRIPSAAFQLSAENVGRDGVRIRATLRSEDVAGIEGGVYEGHVIVLRSEEPPIPATLVVAVNDRAGLYPLAVWWLVVGGVAGLLTRWLGEIGAALALSYRRLRRLRRLLPQEDRHLLSVDVSDEFADAAEALEARDTAALAKSVARLEANLPLMTATSRALRRVSEVARRLARIADDQADELVKRSARRVASALEALVRRQQDSAWPWDDRLQLAALRGRIEALVAATDRVDDLIDGVAAGDETPVARLRDLAAAIGLNGPATLLKPTIPKPTPKQIENLHRRDPVVQAPIPSPVHKPQPSKRDLPAEDESTSLWAGPLMSAVGAAPGTALVLVLVIVGFMTKVADPTSFDGSFIDGIALFVWAFGVAVTGGTVLTVLGQVKQSAPSVAPPAAPTTSGG